MRQAFTVNVGSAIVRDGTIETEKELSYEVTHTLINGVSIDMGIDIFQSWYRAHKNQRDHEFYASIGKLAKELQQIPGINMFDILVCNYISEGRLYNHADASFFDSICKGLSKRTSTKNPSDLQKREICQTFRNEYNTASPANNFEEIVVKQILVDSRIGYYLDSVAALMTNGITVEKYLGMDRLSSCLVPIKSNGVTDGDAMNAKLELYGYDENTRLFELPSDSPLVGDLKPNFQKIYFSSGFDPLNGRNIFENIGPRFVDSADRFLSMYHFTNPCPIRGEVSVTTDTVSYVFG